MFNKNQLFRNDFIRHSIKYIFVEHIFKKFIQNMTHSVYIYYTYLSECTANKFAGNDARFPIIDSFFFYYRVTTKSNNENERERERKRMKKE